MDKKYEFVEIVKDYAGDYVGVIRFNYNNTERDHEFTFVTREQELVSIDYGWKIPFLSDVWDDIENRLREHSAKYSVAIA